MSEYLFFVKMTEENNTCVHSKLYVHFREDGKVFLSLTSDTANVEVVGRNYVDALISLLNNLKEGSIIIFNHTVTASTGDSLEFIEITETVNLSYLPSIDDKMIHFELNCTINNQFFSASAPEDFSIALQKLKNKTNLEFQICAFCNNSDFQSTGGEDLRFGWSCLRNLHQRELSLPWYERVHEFEKSTPNLSAIHWCPSFKESDKEFI
ncbi:MULTISPECIES: hypothetical protein [unclassified Paenibacillus]|uniref:hypothetical protein n=1 Tax=unclassified Paenibacillus TaxID=185978 RepID=UPI00115FCFFB|nr:MULTISPECIES: hypothetical protein [unclassified Paenibacillus]